MQFGRGRLVAQRVDDVREDLRCEGLDAAAADSGQVADGAEDSGGDRGSSVVDAGEGCSEDRGGVRADEVGSVGEEVGEEPGGLLSLRGGA